jgi:4-hydroxy-tetrahydrodipicolinate synthase
LSFLEGVFSVLPTPFHDDASLDMDSMRRVIDLFIGGGVSGLTALGVTGEVARLTEKERITVLETVVNHAAGRVAVVAGTTAEGLHTCIEYTRNAKSAGAAAVMISPPRMAKLNSEAVVRHFAAVAEAVDIEIVVQDYPPISGFTMEAAYWPVSRPSFRGPARSSWKIRRPRLKLLAFWKPQKTRRYASSADWAACSFWKS